METIDYIQKRELEVVDNIGYRTLLSELEEGTRPIRIKEFVEQNVMALESRVNRLIKAWQTQTLTSDAFIHSGDGRIKYIPNFEKTKELSNFKFVEDRFSENKDAISLGNKDFDFIPAREFSKEQISEYANRSMNKGELSKNPLWLEFVEGDEELLQRFDSLARRKSTKVDADLTFAIETPPSLPEGYLPLSFLRINPKAGYVVYSGFESFSDGVFNNEEIDVVLEKKEHRCIKIKDRF